MLLPMRMAFVAWSSPRATFLLSLPSPLGFLFICLPMLFLVCSAFPLFTHLKPLPLSFVSLICPPPFFAPYGFCSLCSTPYFCVLVRVILPPCFVSLFFVAFFPFSSLVGPSLLIFCLWWGPQIDQSQSVSISPKLFVYLAPLYLP